MTAEDTKFDTPLDYKDKRTSLIISGIILGLIGCLLVLLSGVYGFIFFFGEDWFAALPAPPPGSVSPGTPDPADYFSGGMRNLMLAAGIIYGFLALGFLWVAFGNVFMKRWSRPLALILATTWAYSGLMGVIWTMITSSKMKQIGYTGMPAGSSPPGGSVQNFFMIIMIVQVAVMIVFGIMLPALIFWLNASRDAKITLETCDRKPRWTDPVPVPVLGIAVVAAATGLMVIASAFWIPMVPAFGQLLTGQKAQIVMLATAAIFLFIGWGAYRRQIAAWVLAIAVVIGGGVSTAITMRNFDWKFIYETLGIPIPAYDEARMEQLMNELYAGPWLVVTTLLGLLLVLSFLVWTLRFFRDAPEKPGEVSGAA